MKKPEEFPLDESKTFNADKVLFIEASTGVSSGTAIFDMTNAIERNYDGMSAQYIHEVETLAKDVDTSLTVFELKRQKFYKRQTTVTDESHTEVAGFSAPVMKLGLVTFSFPKDSPHCSHDIEMKPVGAFRRTNGFVKDSIQYFWDKHDNIAMLTKVVGEMRVEVAKFGAKHTWDKGGVLALDTANVDEVVAVITCVALLQQLDSFAGPST